MKRVSEKARGRLLRRDTHTLWLPLVGREGEKVWRLSHSRALRHAPFPMEVRLASKSCTLALPTITPWGRLLKAVVMGLVPLLVVVVVVVVPLRLACGGQ